MPDCRWNRLIENFLEKSEGLCAGMRKDPYVGWIELFEGLIVGYSERRGAETCGVVGRRQLPMQRTVLEGGGMPSFSVVIEISI